MAENFNFPDVYNSVEKNNTGETITKEKESESCIDLLNAKIDRLANTVEILSQKIETNKQISKSALWSDLVTSPTNSSRTTQNKRARTEIEDSPTTANVSIPKK